MKNTFIFTYSTNILVLLLTVDMKNSLTPKNKRPHYSQPIHENATSSSGTSPLVSNKEVPTPPSLRGLWTVHNCTDSNESWSEEHFLNLIRLNAFNIVRRGKITLV